MTDGAPPHGPTDDRAEAVAAAVARAIHLVPFYAHHLGGRVGTSLLDLPTCTKTDLAPWGAFPLQAGPQRDVVRVAATSGTTGQRMFVGYTAADWDAIGDQLGRRAHDAGLGSGHVLANTHGYGLWIGGPSLDLLATRAGATLFPCGPVGVEQFTAWLTTMPITAMSATPSYLRLLAERVAAGAIDTSSWQLRLALVGGEPASTALRRQVVDTLDVDLRWQELYGSTEVGGPVLGWSPPDEPWSSALHLDTDQFVVELLHPERDEPVAEGELGEITVTTPWREATPLIRYRTRDLAAQLPTPAGGRPRISAIAGRIDDALKVRGALVYPAVIERVVVARVAVGSEWRIVLDRAPGELDVLTIVVERDEQSEPDVGGAAFRAALGTEVADAIGVRCGVDVVAPGSLERFGGKARRVTDRR